MNESQLIPLAAVLISAAFGAVSIAWDSERRATRSMGAIFLCTGSWALLDLATLMTDDPERALRWMRWAHLPVLMIGPSAIWVVGQILPEARLRMVGRARIAAVVCAVLGVGAALSPANIEVMVATADGGWMPRYGWLGLTLIPLVTLLPVYAACAAARAQRSGRGSHSERRRAWALRACVGVSLVAFLPSEYLLPVLGIPFPRLGALGVSVASALLWLRVLHEMDDLALTPQGVARALLAELHDGVVLVRADGLILSTNTRFARMAGRASTEIPGTSIEGLLDAPIGRLPAGSGDRQSMLRGPGGLSIPVSLSSSVLRNQSGGTIGFVVVCRDLREIDSLRSQLLSSGRLAAIGELAAGIAHEVNNPVAFIRSDLNLLAARIGELRGRLVSRPGPEGAVAICDRSQGRVANALEGIDRVAEIVRDVREFAHTGGEGQGGSDPGDVVESAMRLARLARGEDVALRLSSKAHTLRIESGQELKQILLSLMRVLVEGAEKGGRLDVEVRRSVGDLVISLFAEPLIESSATVLARFDGLGVGALDGSHDEFGLAVAVELIDRLGGGLSIEASATHAIQVEIALPLTGEGAGA